MLNQRRNQFFKLKKKKKKKKKKKRVEYCVDKSCIQIVVVTRSDAKRIRAKLNRPALSVALR